MRDGHDPEHAAAGGEPGAGEPVEPLTVGPDDPLSLAPGDPLSLAPGEDALDDPLGAFDDLVDPRVDPRVDGVVDPAGAADAEADDEEDDAPLLFGAERPDADGSATVAGFRRLATRIADAVLGLAPEEAPGGSRAARTGRLADLTPDGVEHAEEVLADALTALDAVDDTVLDVGDAVDLEILRGWVAGLQWRLMERGHEHDPLVHVPVAVVPSAGAVPALPAGSPLDTGALDTVVTLLRCAAGRLDDLPHRLAHARESLHDLNVLAVDTALVRTRRLLATLPQDVAALAAPVGDPDAVVPGVTESLARAVEALTEHAGWLAAARPGADADPRLGAQRYGARLWYGLDAELDPDALLVRAESDLLAVEEELAELAGLLGAPAGADGVRDVLRDVAAGAADGGEAALDDVLREMAGLDLVTLPDGLAGPARCPVEGRPESVPGDVPALDEVGGALRHVVAAHRGVPGHRLQAAHAAAADLPTATRLVVPSRLFVEGWAVHAESLLTLSDAGTPAQRARRRVAHLGLQLRRAVRCIVDVRCHVHGMAQDDAVALLVERAHLSDATAARLVAATLVHPVEGSVGYVGDHLVADVVSRLGAARPDAGARAVHDRVLAHGPVPPRHLAVLLGLPSESAGRR